MTIRKRGKGYQVDVQVDGKRIRKQFNTLRDAKSFRAALKQGQRQRKSKALGNQRTQSRRESPLLDRSQSRKRGQLQGCLSQGAVTRTRKL